MNALFPVHATTLDIIVHVAVTFLPEQSEPDRGRWFWAYHIRIENRSDESAQLLSRHWRITDATGRVSLVDGDGVVGVADEALVGRVALGEVCERARGVGDGEVATAAAAVDEGID